MSIYFPSCIHRSTHSPNDSSRLSCNFTFVRSSYFFLAGLTDFPARPFEVEVHERRNMTLQSDDSPWNEASQRSTSGQMSD